MAEQGFMTFFSGTGFDFEGFFAEICSGKEAHMNPDRDKNDLVQLIDKMSGETVRQVVCVNT